MISETSNDGKLFKNQVTFKQDDSVAQIVYLQASCPLESGVPKLLLTVLSTVCLHESNYMRVAAVESFPE